ncbi:MAG: hypothetical protein HYY93_06120 [Planctomycetes bacterium]|nr:hypothetical protein [Planctomycetota bacterium]
MRTTTTAGGVGGLVLCIAVSGCCLGLHPPRVRVDRAGPEVRLADYWGGHVPDEFAPYLARVKPALDKNPLPAEEAYSVVEVERTATHTVHVAQVRGTLPERVHLKHHETVCILRGGGQVKTAWLWNRETPRAVYDVHPGQRVVFRPGQIHGFTNTSAEPTVAILIFSPPAAPGDDAPMLIGPRPEPRSAPARPGKGKAADPAKTAAATPGAAPTKNAPAESTPKAGK